MQYISGVSGKSAEVLRVKERMLSSNPGQFQRLDCEVRFLLAGQGFAWFVCLRIASDDLYSGVLIRAAD